MIETDCPNCLIQSTLVPAQVIIGRLFPNGDGSLAYYCDSCRTPVALTLSCDAVMLAVFAGAEPIDEESLGRPEY